MAKYPESLDDKPPPPKRSTWTRSLVRQLLRSSFWIVLASLIGLILWPYVVITVPSGYVGVLWRRFNGFDAYCLCFAGRGTALNPRQIRDEGLHMIWPWNKLYLYNLRLQSEQLTVNAISRDGVRVVAHMNIRYQLRHNNVGVLHKFIGPDYLKSVIEPEIGSQAREVIAGFGAQEVYVTRERIQNQIRTQVQKSLGAHLNQLVQLDAMEESDPYHYEDYLQDSIQILDTLVLGIELPEPIVEAINRQTQQYYMIQETRFRVEREMEESKRKQVEAQGIAAFQQTVSQGISESYLRWRGIEATSALANSPNAKVVIIGGGKDSLPVILGNTDFPAPLNPPASPTETKPPDTKAPEANQSNANQPSASSSNTGSSNTGSSNAKPSNVLVPRVEPIIPSAASSPSGGGG